jgi:hypothetical protein
MTEAEWDRGTDLTAMLRFLRSSGVLTERKARLFAAACYRLIWWSLLYHEESRGAVEVAERFADGLATEQERDRAWDKADDVFTLLADEFDASPDSIMPDETPQVRAAYLAAWVASSDAALAAQEVVKVANAGEWPAQRELLLDLFGPFRSARFESSQAGFGGTEAPS